MPNTAGKQRLKDALKRMTPELTARLKAAKPELLSILPQCEVG